MLIRSSLSARGRKLLLIAFVFTIAALVGGTLAPTPTEASTRCGTEFYYYGDSSLTDVVGVWGWLPTQCGCQSYFWGTITPYRTVHDSWC